MRRAERGVAERVVVEPNPPRGGAGAAPRRQAAGALSKPGRARRGAPPQGRGSPHPGVGGGMAGAARVDARVASLRTGALVLTSTRAMSAAEAARRATAPAPHGHLRSRCERGERRKPQVPTPPCGRRQCLFVLKGSQPHHRGHASSKSDRHQAYQSFTFLIECIIGTLKTPRSRFVI